MFLSLFKKIVNFINFVKDFLGKRCIFFKEQFLQKCLKKKIS